MANRFLDMEDEDPILSVVNLVDLFIVIIGILMVVLVKNPFNPFSSDNAILVENPGEEDMRITVKEGKELTQYESSGEIGEGEGIKAGTAYRLPDGRMVYVPAGGE